MGLSAGGSVNSSGSLSGINLGDIGTAITKQQQLVTTGADAEAAAKSRATVLTSQSTQEQLNIANQSLQSQEDTTNQRLKILDGINGQISKANIAIKLADSTNPLDRIKLWALQQSDPSYTREGNTARIDYLQKASDAVGGMDTLKQTVYQDQIAASKNKLALALEPDNQILAQMQIGIDQGQRKIDAAVAASNTRLGLMQQQSAMQENVISNLDSTSAATALQQAQQSPDKTVIIGGVQVSMANLEDRKAKLADRSYQEYARGLLMQDAAVGQMTMPDVDTKIAEAQTSKNQKAVLDDGTVVSLAKLQERRTALLVNDATAQSAIVQSANAAKTMKDTADRKILGTMTPTELNATTLNGGVDPKNPSNKYDLGLINEVKTQLQTAKDDQLKTAATVAAIGDPDTALADFDQYMKTAKTFAPPTSQLAAGLKNSSDLFAYGASLLKSKDPEEAAMGATIIQGQRDQVEKMIAAQAKIDSNGDKQKEIALGYQYRGQQIPQEVVATALTEKMSKNLPLTGWLTPDNAAIFARTFQTAKQQILADSLTGANAGIPPAKADVEAQATQAAMQAVMQNAAAGVTEQLLQSQLGVPGNPLAAVNLKAGDLLSLYRAADQQGMKNYKDAGNKSDEDMQKLATGQSVDPDLSAAQASAFYTALEKIQPGLGKQYTDWWNGPGRDQLVTTYSTYAQQNAAKAGFQQLAQTSLVLPTLGDQMSAHAQATADGERNYYAADLANQHQQFVTFGGSSAAKEAFLLEQDKNLTDSDKKQAMSLLIQPLLKQVVEQKMPAAQATTFIEGNLRSMRPDDPGTKKLLTKILTGRDAAQKTVDDFIKAQPQQQNEDQGIMSLIVGAARNVLGVSGVPLDNAKRAQFATSMDKMTGFTWYQDWKKQLAGN